MADYRPHNPTHDIEYPLTTLEAMLTPGQAEHRARTSRTEAARDKAIAAAHAFHDATLGAKAEVIAQYGATRRRSAGIGLKRKSDRRRPSRRSAASA